MSIPKGWEEVRLGDIGQIVGGGTPLTTCSDFWDNGDIVWLTPTEIDHKYITDSKRKITQKGLENSSAKILPINTILISTRATIGEVGIAKVECCTNQGFQSLICGDSVNHEFIYYLIKNEKETLLKLACGTTFLEISPKSLKSIKIKLPPLKEQEKIAEILSSCDEHIKNLKNLKSELEKEKLHLMNELLNGKTRFSSFTTPWQEVKLGDICQITTGKLNANAMVEDGEYPFFTCAKEVFKIDEYAFDGEALLVSGNGAYVGYVHYYNGKFNAYQRTYVLENVTQNIHFIKHYLKQYLPNRIKREKNEGNTPYIVLSVLADMKIKLPSLEEQKKIGEVLSACDERLECLNELITAQTTLKSHLLTELLSGSIRVKIN